MLALPELATVADADRWLRVAHSSPAFGEPRMPRSLGSRGDGASRTFRLSRLPKFPPSADRRCQALLEFGPNAASRSVPRGAFLAEGTIDPAQGMMALAPVQWVMQPPSYSWLGLRGRSSDGGKTWRGQVTDSLTCTVFTLQRMQTASEMR